MDGSERSGFRRRDLLRAMAVGATGLASGCAAFDSEATPTRTPTGTAGTPSTADAPADADYETRDIPFKRTVDVVDAGADPNGESDLAPAIQSLMRDGTLLVFPPGRYRIETPITVPEDRVGLVADGDVTFELTPALPDQFLVADGVDAFLFRGFDVDLRGQPNSGMQVYAPTKFYVEDVRYVGRGGPTGIGFALAVTRPRGTGYLRGVRVPNGGRPDLYNQPDGSGGDGRIGVWTGLDHRGTLRITGSEFSEFGNNGLYTSRTPGDVQVLDSYFENNNVCSVRIGGAGSYVDGCHVIVDFTLYDGPPLTSTETGFNPRGIMIDDGAATDELGRQPPGAEVRDTRVDIEQVPPGTSVQAAILQNPTARSLTVANTAISVDVDQTPAVTRSRPGAGEWIWRPSRDVPPKPHWTHLRQTTITGSASEGSAILLEEADGSQIVDCHLDQPGIDRDGLSIRNAPSVVVDGGEFRTGGFPLVVAKTSVGGPNRCRLGFGDPPGLETLADPGALSRYGSLQAAGDDLAAIQVDGEATCVIGGADDQLGDGPWELRVAAVGEDGLLGRVVGP